jgi:hypothetical protein
MSNAVRNSSLTRLVIQFEIAFGFFTVLFFLLFSTNVGAGEYPEWYSFGTTILELFAFLLAAVLCLRNAFSPMLVSSRKVWMGIGLGMLFYFIGNLFFAYWELGLKREPDVSPGDLFYILSYLCLMLAMGLAVFERRLNLSGLQYGIISAVGAIGVVVAVVLATSGGAEAAAKEAAQLNPFQAPPAIAATVQADRLAFPAQAAPSLNALIAQNAIAQTPPKAAPAKAAAKTVNAPGWVVAIEELLNPFKTLLSFLYLIADTVLLIIATTLFLAFWGGRFAQSWRMIAAGTFCLYIADAWFKFATLRLPNYQSGGFLEVGWVLSAILFGLGAALEYNASQMRRNTGRRRA